MATPVVKGTVAGCHCRDRSTSPQTNGSFCPKERHAYTYRMAKVDLVRRAQIGQEKRARTRAALVTAAKSLFALRSIESITVDEIVAEAGLAKGTFYTHFEDLHALTAAVADELLAAFDDLMQPAR